MDHQTVIDWYLEQLQRGSADPVPDTMQQYIDEHPDLAAEIKTLTGFWQTPVVEQQPSAALRERFYAGLEAEQQRNKAVPKPRLLRWWQSASQYLTVHPAAQFASYALVFALGMGASNWQPDDAPQIEQLRAEMNSLSSMVALSLLQNPSASERLSGVAYSLRNQSGDPELTRQLVTMLATDESTTVRLAIIDALSQQAELVAHESQLIALTVEETSPLVQMELCRLLLTRSSTQARQQLFEQLEQIELHPDVGAFVDAIKATTTA